MEQNIKTTLFIKITTFILLCWICHFCIYISTLKKTLDEKKNNRSILHARTYRLLAIYKKDNDSSTLCLKEEMSINGMHEINDITNNEKDDLGKKKRSNECPSKCAGGYKRPTKNKSCTFETKKYSHTEKKIFKELDYTDFLKNNKAISDKIYNKIILKKFGLRIFLPVLIFLFLLIIFILEISLNSVKPKSTLLSELGLNKEFLKPLSEGEWKSFLSVLKNLGGFLKHSVSDSAGTATCIMCDTANSVSDACILGQFFRILIYFVPFIILSITVIIGIIYYHKKVNKYEKIKYRKR
ncbi:fam-l protein [Plasmodium malariae]|uniref:Fam-l protein n=1 Tax=Plasmodium malariae TaxID=5858 RepID=A0A1D3JH29_PLAMA|nr:fam-l protein [Plasmodium malariae]SBT85601.1 fam-l protein [Plasmodium malariae]